jgi:hypothetical protein
MQGLYEAARLRPLTHVKVVRRAGIAPRAPNHCNVIFTVPCPACAFPTADVADPLV